MPATSYPHGWHAYVADHHQATTGYVVAQSGECLDIKDQETIGPRRRIAGRTFQPIRPNDLGSMTLPKSWFMGIILCPGDDLTPILAWMRNLSQENRSRVVLYAHPRYDQAAGMSQLQAAGLHHVRVTDFIGSWGNFHHLYGNDHSWQVWNDKT